MWSAIRSIFQSPEIPVIDTYGCTGDPETDNPEKEKDNAGI